MSKPVRPIGPAQAANRPAIRPASGQSDQETSPMSRVLTRRLAAFALAFAGTVAAIGTADADIKNFEFQLVKTELKAGMATIEVRLIDKRTGSPVPGAVVFASRIDMAPDRMPTM